jgi:putative membrane protein
MFLPLFIVGGWATAIRCISVYVHNSKCIKRIRFLFNLVLIIFCLVAVNQVLLTVLGFVVALALSFRTSSAYER